jgi:hypothetical protein
MTSSVISRAHHMAEAGDQVPALYMLTVLALAAIVFSIYLISVRRSRRRAPRRADPGAHRRRVASERGEAPRSTATRALGIPANFLIDRR